MFSTSGAGPSRALPGTIKRNRRVRPPLLSVRSPCTIGWGARQLGLRQRQGAGLRRPAAATAGLRGPALRSEGARPNRSSGSGARAHAPLWSPEKNLLRLRAALDLDDPADDRFLDRDAALRVARRSRARGRARIVEPHVRTDVRGPPAGRACARRGVSLRLLEVPSVLGWILCRGF